MIICTLTLAQNKMEEPEEKQEEKPQEQAQVVTCSPDSEKGNKLPQVAWPKKHYITMGSS